MTRAYRRNRQFRKDLPKYRFALRKWMWRDKKRMTSAVQLRWQTVRYLEDRIFDWDVHCWFPFNFFIEPPDNLIKEVLSWD